MSHFTHMKTRFQNLLYLKKSLNRLNLTYTEQKITKDSTLETRNLIIPQANGYNVEFVWNGEEYELIVDLSFWEQSYPVESFMDKLTQQYAGEIIIGESQKTGFQPIKYKQNLDKSNTLVLERWNNKN